MFIPQTRWFWFPGGQNLCCVRRKPFFQTSLGILMLGTHFPSTGTWKTPLSSAQALQTFCVSPPPTHAFCLGTGGCASFPPCSRKALHFPVALRMRPGLESASWPVHRTPGSAGLLSSGLSSQHRTFQLRVFYLKVKAYRSLPKPENRPHASR